MTIVAALLLGTLTTGVGVASAPGLLRVTGPVLCPSGSDFVTREGRSYVRPDNRHVAPIHFACVAPGGAESAPNMLAAAALVFAVVTSLWALVVSRATARLEAAAKGRA